MLGATPTAIVNQAIQYIGNNQPPVTGTLPTFDTSPAGVAAANLYTRVVQTVGRQFGWDFARNVVVLALTANVAPYPWAYEYLYPTNGLEIRQLIPPTTADANNPLPVSWTVGNSLISAVPTKVIWSNLASASAAISNQPPEATWDAGFTEAVVRLLASEMAMAIAGKPDTSQTLLTSAQGFEQVMEARDG